MTAHSYDPATIATLALRLDTPEKLEANGALHGAATIGANAMLRTIGDALRTIAADLSDEYAHRDSGEWCATAATISALRPILAAAPDSRADALRAFSARANDAGLSLVALVDVDEAGAREAASAGGFCSLDAADVVPARSDPCAVRMHAWDALTWREKSTALRQWQRTTARAAFCIDCDGCGAKAGSVCKSAEGGGNG